MSSETADQAGLLEAARSGDAQARDRLVREHIDAVYRAALSVLGDPDAAADATQDAFVNALAALEGFRGDSSVRTWLTRIAVNTARSRGRRRGRRREVAIEKAASVASPAPAPDRSAVAVLEAERVERALGGLPEKQRLCVSLRIREDLSYAEIGRIAGCSEGSARVNYHYGVQRLRELLNDDDDDV